MHLRVHYLYILLLLILTGCSGETSEVETPEGRVIAFSYSTMDVSESLRDTRAGQGLGHDFIVCGYKKPSAGSMQYIMPRYAVRYSGGQYTYASSEQPLVYWDDQAAEYRFWGFTGDKGSMSEDGRSVVIDNVELQVEDPVTAYPLFSDVYVRKSPISYVDVVLQFSRPVAKVGVLFYNESPIREGRKIDISHITLAPVADAVAPKVSEIWNSGKVKVTYPDLAVDRPEVTTSVEESSTTTKSGYLAFLDVTLTEGIGDNVNNAVIALIPVDKTDIVLPDDIPGEDLNSVEAKGRTRAGSGQHPDHYYPLPMGDKNPDFVLNITLEGNERSVIIPEAFTHWQANRSYTYYIKITNNGEALLSDAKIEGWTSGGSQDDEFNNW